MRINKEKLYEIVCKVLGEIDSVSKNEPDIIPFKIEDYWNLSSLTNGQIDSLNTDLSVFIHGNGYGDVLQYIDGKPVISESYEKRTYTFDEVKKVLKSKFWFSDWQIREDDGENNVKLILLFSVINQNYVIIVKEMETLGWTKSYITDEIYVNGIPVIAISFDPLYQLSIKDTVRRWAFVLHASPSYNKESILQKGLIPSSQNSRFDYPPRVHLLKPTIPYTELKRICEVLSQTNNDPRNNGEYCLLQVDLSKVPEDIEFYFDPRYEYGIYSKKTIPSNAITYVNSMNVK